MKYIHDTTEFYSEVPTAVTLGKFDGLHRGHQRLLHEVSVLQKQGIAGVAFTIAPENRMALLLPEEKRKMFEAYGMDCMIQCPYIPEVLSMEPERFISEILVKALRVNCIVVGTDFRFGHDRRGDAAMLASLAGKYGYSVRILEKECYHGREISSTYVKEALAEGDMELVEELLGYAYPVTGVVLHGRQLGRRIGMPTVNLIPDSRKLLPPNGVYFSEVKLEDKIYQGVTNIGYKPTIDGSFLGVETYLYGVDRDLYGCELEVRFLKFRRPEYRFDSIDELKAQMERDIQAGKEYFSV